MGILIMVDGKPFTPERALREQLPLDTNLRCPQCNGGPVKARAAKTTIRLGGEAQAFIPRMQDRQCEQCGHQWQCVLPPAIYSNAEWLAQQPR